MFEKLVVSTAQRPQRRTLKFLAYTSLIYVTVVGVAFALSILLETPKLADSSATPFGPVIWQGGTQKPKLRDNAPAQPAVSKDLRNVQRLETIISNVGQRQQATGQPVPPGTQDVGEGDLPEGEEGPGLPGVAMPSGRAGITTDLRNDPPRPPDPPQPQPRAADRQKPLLVSSVVLQGKAIERAVPIYPELPRRIRLQGDVSVEVIISPEGRVESVRVVSGHPLLVQSAIDAARRWRFEATYLNGVAVRVTGVITFKFKIND